MARGFPKEISRFSYRRFRNHSASQFITPVGNHVPWWLRWFNPLHIFQVRHCYSSTAHSLSNSWPIGKFRRGSYPAKGSPSVWALTEACVGSASKSLKILSIMHDKNLLHKLIFQILLGGHCWCLTSSQNFIPFDLENTFASLFTVKAV